MRPLPAPATYTPTSDDHEGGPQTVVAPRGVSLAVLLLEAPENLEAALVAHFTTTCQFCKGRLKRWYGLCSVHATLTRSIIEPDYLATLRQEAQDARERESLYLANLSTIERAENGRAWLEANKDHPNVQGGKRKLQGIIDELPPGMKTMTLSRLRTLIEFTSRQIAYYNAKIELISSWSDRIIEVLEELHGTAAPAD